MKLQLLIVSLSLFFVSCKEESIDSDVETEVIEVTLEGTELYQYKFGDTRPVEGGYSIRKQAQHFQISEMRWATYNYQAKEGFKGFETVEIVLFMSPGDNNFTDEERWIFEITVE